MAKRKAVVEFSEKEIQHVVAAVATVVGVLIEVPVVLMLVRICLRTSSWFPTAGA